MSRGKKRFWSDDEKREICTQAATAGFSGAQVARRYAMNSIPRTSVSRHQCLTNLDKRPSWPISASVGFKSKLGVTAIANWCFTRSLTSAKEDLTIRFCRVLHRCEIRTFMASITKGLLAALTAGTPEVTLPSFNFSGVRRFLRNDRL
jgi:hypothetical protein